MSSAEGDVALNSQLTDVHDAFITALINTGVMGKLRAQLRAAALGLIQDDKAMFKSLGAEAPLASLPQSTQLALLLVDEFLQVRSLKRSHGIYHEESNVEQLAGVKVQLQEPVFTFLGTAGNNNGGASTSLLETLLSSVLSGACGTQTREAAQALSLGESLSSSQPRAPSPDIEMPLKPSSSSATAPAATSAASSGSLSRKTSMSNPATAVADPCEDSIEYSDHSANSSLDLANCDALERFGGDGSDGKNADVRSGTTSEDDF